MAKNQRFLRIDVVIIEDHQWEPDETFFARLSLLGENREENLRLGPKKICMVSIIDDKEPGEVEFAQSVHVVKESVGTFSIRLERRRGADGDVAIAYRTEDIKALAGKDYLAASGVLEFKHGEASKTIPITILDGLLFKRNCSKLKDDMLSLWPYIEKIFKLVVL